MNTLIICSTIAICIYIICYYINKLIDKAIESDTFINSIYDDMDTIKDIIGRTFDIELYNDVIKHNLSTINRIVSKYVEESEIADTSTKES